MRLTCELRTSTGPSRRELAERVGTTRSVTFGWRKAEGAALDTLARVATALDRDLVVSIPNEVPERPEDAIPSSAPP